MMETKYELSLAIAKPLVDKDSGTSVRQFGGGQRRELPPSD
jgi:hypothetical protein